MTDRAVVSVNQHGGGYFCGSGIINVSVNTTVPWAVYKS